MAGAQLIMSYMFISVSSRFQASFVTTPNFPLISGIPSMSLSVQLLDEFRTTDGFESLTAKMRAEPPVNSREWWQDRYVESERLESEIRSRYKPLSWNESVKDFYSVEDGQPTIVSCHIFFLIYSLNW